MTGRAQPRRRRGKGMVASGAVAVALAGVLVFAVTRYAARNPDKVRLGDPVYEAGEARRLARAIARDGEPILLPDLLGDDRDLILNHLGPIPRRGWVAFEAHRPGGVRRCNVRWDRAAGLFRDPCEGTTYRPNGDAVDDSHLGLRRYETTVTEGGMVVVDLRRPAP